MNRRPRMVFASPRKLPKAKELAGRVLVLDLAFASEASGKGFDALTGPFIEALGERLAAWVDHHDHVLHERFAHDARFVLATKAEHGACPEMVTEKLVARIGAVDTIVCHTDFDGLCSAAKWVRGGVEPYPGADDDARAIDTRVGRPSPLGERFDRALRARPRDVALFGIIVRHLADGLTDASLWLPIDAAAAELAALEATTRAIAAAYVVVPIAVGAPGLPKGAHRIAIVDASATNGRYEKTLLLLLGQERAPLALVIDAHNATFAAPFGSGTNFLLALGLSGGMPTLVSIPRSRVADALSRLGVTGDDAEQFVK